MARLAMIDGVVHAPETAKVSIYDRGFLYGDSVFETVRTYGGRLFALDEHLCRLEESAAKMGLELPTDKATLAKETRQVLAEAGNAESYVRIMLTRGAGPMGLDTSLAEQALRVLFVEPLKVPPPEHYLNGLTAHCVQTVRASDAADNAKVGNYLASLLALKKAREEGAHEALVVNRDGCVVEGTTSNVFVVRGNELITPAVEAGVLAGITRQIVIELAAKLGLTVVFRALPPDEILRAEELFLSSSIRELMPIVALDGQSIGNGRPGPTTRALHRAFRQHVGMDGKLPFEVEGVALEGS